MMLLLSVVIHYSRLGQRDRPLFIFCVCFRWSIYTAPTMSKISDKAGAMMSAPKNFGGTPQVCLVSRLVRARVTRYMHIAWHLAMLTGCNSVVGECM